MAEDMWDVSAKSGNKRSAPRQGTPRPARSPLIVTPRQRLIYVATSKVTKITTAFLVVGVVATSTFLYRGPLTDAYATLTGTAPLPTPTVVVSTSPVPTVDPAQRLELIQVGRATGELESMLTEATGLLESLSDSTSDEVSQELLDALTDAITQARRIIATGDATADDLDGVRAVLEDAITAVDADITQRRDEKAAAEKEAAEKEQKKQESEQPEPSAPKPVNPKPEPQPAPKPKPKPDPPPAPIQRATASTTATCTEPSTITFTATGGGAVELSAGGTSKKGSGTATLTLTGTTGATARASADGNVFVSWSSVGSCT